MLGEHTLGHLESLRGVCLWHDDDEMTSMGERCDDAHPKLDQWPAVELDERLWDVHAESLATAGADENSAKGWQLVRRSAARRLFVVEYAHGLQATGVGGLEAMKCMRVRRERQNLWLGSENLVEKLRSLVLISLLSERELRHENLTSLRKHALLAS